MNNDIDAAVEAMFGIANKVTSEEMQGCSRAVSNSAFAGICMDARECIRVRGIQKEDERLRKGEKEVQRRKWRPWKINRGALASLDLARIQVQILRA